MAPYFRQISQRRIPVPAGPVTDRNLLLDAMVVLSDSLSKWPLQNIDCYPDTAMFLRIAEHVGFPLQEVYTRIEAEGHGGAARKFIRDWVHDNR